MNNGDFENKNNDIVNDDTDVNKFENDREVTNDNKNAEDIQSSEKEGVQVAEQEEKAIEGEEQEIECQTQNGCEEERSSNQDSQGSSVNGNTGYSTHYAPPNYVPNFTVSGASTIYNSYTDDDKKKQNNSFTKGTVIALCAFTLVLSLIIGSVAGVFLNEILPFGKGSNVTDRVVNILKSDREIIVEDISVNVGDSNLTVAQVAALVGESVVEITTTHVQSSVGYGQYIQSGAGSGVIISYDSASNLGYIVTNFHVIEGADKVTVRIKNSDSYYDYTAQYIAGSPAEDIAVLSVNTNSDHKLKPATVTKDSSKLTVGQQVVAIGNPLGQLGGTVTDGIISALDREIIVENYPMVLLQTNAAINPGNSGGGLFNMSGELIGIVNAKQSDTGIEGLGFAIPSNVVYTAIKDLLELGYISGRTTLGIQVYYGRLGMQQGLFVTNIGQTSLRLNDRITKIGNTEISSLASYYVALRRLNIGDSVEVRYVRNGAESKITVKVQEDTTKYAIK